MLPALLVVLCAGPQPLHVALPGLTSSGTSAEKTAVLSDVLVEELRRGGIKVTTARDLSALLGAERQRQLLGCSAEAGSCLAELSDALGADGILTGTLGVIGSSWVVSLSVVKASGGAAAGHSFKTSEAGLLGELRAAGAALVEQLRAAYPDRFAAPASRFGARFWIPAGLGVAAAGAGVGMIIGANGVGQALLANPQALMSRAELDEKLGLGRTLQTGGFIALGVGVAGLGTGLLLALLAPVETPAVALSVSRDGAFVAFGGRWP